ncbi:hypothetical protein AAFF_G00215960 [Aldrovandia affinis]|uniref:Uncharacterized protein n=1 Tax=Aldrovandia affinis TaxID=143900 RepID=A0AAD7W518_9TELE|nr:hypothetical protein AAFF_G00215960 [Aldrovandia affinis]
MHATSDQVSKATKEPADLTDGLRCAQESAAAKAHDLTLDSGAFCEAVAKTREENGGGRSPLFLQHLCTACDGAVSVEDVHRLCQRGDRTHELAEDDVVAAVSAGVAAVDDHRGHAISGLAFGDVTLRRGVSSRTVYTPALACDVEPDGIS